MFKTLRKKGITKVVHLYIYIEKRNWILKNFSPTKLYKDKDEKVWK